MKDTKTFFRISNTISCLKLCSLGSKLRYLQMIALDLKDCFDANKKLVKDNKRLQAENRRLTADLKKQFLEFRKLLRKRPNLN